MEHNTLEIILLRQPKNDAIDAMIGALYALDRLDVRLPEKVIRNMTQPLYSIKTWDPDLQQYTHDDKVPSHNLTRAQLVASIRILQDHGYSCHRVRERDDDGNHTGWSDSDPSVLIERVN